MKDLNLREHNIVRSIYADTTAYMEELMSERSEDMTVPAIADGTNMLNIARGFIKTRDLEGILTNIGGLSPNARNAISPKTLNLIRSEIEWNEMVADLTEDIGELL